MELIEVARRLKESLEQELAQIAEELLVAEAEKDRKHNLAVEAESAFFKVKGRATRLQEAHQTLKNFIAMEGLNVRTAGTGT